MDIQKDISLKKFNTFGIEANAEYYSAFQNIEELQDALTAYQKIDPGRNQFVLGGGSNILILKNIKGLVLKNEVAGIEKISENNSEILIKAGAGVNWHSFVLYCLENGYGGVENLALIPGSVGASPMQNIGAYGVEIKDVFHSLEAWHIPDKQLVTFNSNDCEFGYRESVFKNRFRDDFVIMSVTYRLSKDPKLNISYGAIQQELEKMGVTEMNIRLVAEAVMNIRRSKLPDPEVIGNAGSFFKNPYISDEQFDALKEKFPGIAGYKLETGYKVAAGWMIEQCGWKGFRRGDAGCHALQALVLVNYGNANGKDILFLSEEIINSVRSKFGVTLEREVNLI